MLSAALKVAAKPEADDSAPLAAATTEQHSSAMLLSGTPCFEVPPTFIPIMTAGGGGDDEEDRKSFTKVFPVRRVYCVGRNYAAHATEMGSDPQKDPPFFFQKSRDCILPVAPGDLSAAVPIPRNARDYQHEVELVIALGQSAHDVTPAEATRLIYGYAVGLDMTRRDLQKTCSALGQPWEVGKCADFSAPVSYIHPVEIFGPPAEDAVIRLEVNGEERQRAKVGDMTWKIPQLIAHLSRNFTLHPGDVIFTGTPAGVGPVHPGDRICAHVQGLAELSVVVVAAPSI